MIEDYIIKNTTEITMESNILNKIEDIDSIKNEFTENGFIKVNGLIKDYLIESINHILSLKKSEIKRKNFIMPGYNTVRKLGVMSYIDLKNTLISDIYNNNSLLSFISHVTNTKVYKIDNLYERIVVNNQIEEGDTHGWHVDDPKYAFVIIMETPKPQYGGSLKLCKNWSKKNYSIDAISEDDIVTVNLEKNDCYILDASSHLHMVEPLKKDSNCERLIINFAYHDSTSINYGETAKLLYKANL